MISKNIHRRHLNQEQKRELLAKLLKVDPSKSNRQVAKAAGVDHKTVAAVRAEVEGRGEIPHVETITDTQGREQPVKKCSTGKDGKRRKVPTKPELEDDEDGTDEGDGELPPETRRVGVMLQISAARDLATGARNRINLHTEVFRKSWLQEFAAEARATTAVWDDLTRELEERFASRQDICVNVASHRFLHDEAARVWHLKSVAAKIDDIEIDDQLIRIVEAAVAWLTEIAKRPSRTQARCGRPIMTTDLFTIAKVKLATTAAPGTKAEDVQGRQRVEQFAPSQSGYPTKDGRRRNCIECVEPDGHRRHPHLSGA